MIQHVFGDDTIDNTQIIKSYNFQNNHRSVENNLQSSRPLTNRNDKGINQVQA